jgi:glycosyltransferase involved in cell wall biosynthesis
LFGKNKVLNIAIIGDDSLPSSTLVHAKMLHELGSEFKRLGHSVVLIAPGSPEQPSKLNVVNIQGIEYWKFKSGVLRGQGKIKRAINETLLSYKAWHAIKSKVRSTNFDLVVCYSPSIFFGLLVKKIKEETKAYSYLVLRDNFPQWAIDEGIISKGSLLEKYFRCFEEINYKVSDKIGLMSPKNNEIFNQQTSDKYSSQVLFNWADLAENITTPFDLRKKLNLTNEFIYFYGGNIGHAQDMGNLLRLASSMQCIDNVHFVFLGQGDEVDLVKDTITLQDLTNTSFLPSVTQDEYKSILKEVDVGLFSLSKHHKSHNFPGKLLGYMHAGLPILGSVNFGNDLIDIVAENNAGYIFVNGEDELFSASAKELAKSPDLRVKTGDKGKQLLKSVFSVESAAQKILSAMEEKR